MTINQSAHTRFNFMAAHPRARVSYRLTAALFLIAGLLTGGGLVVNAIAQAIESEATRETALAIPVGLGLIVWTIMSACATYLTSAEISLTDGVLSAHVVGPWTITLPITSESLSLGSRQIQLPYRRLNPDERLFTVPLTGLRLAERLGAIYLGVGIKPVLYITPDHENYQNLVQQIMPDYVFNSEAEELS